MPGAVRTGSAKTANWVIAESCIDVLDKACIEECPVDCIYEGERALCIQPDECVDCGACEPVCPVEAIFYQDEVPTRWAALTADNAQFFTEPLPGQSPSLHSAGGASKVGPLGADTPLVASYPTPS